MIQSFREKLQKSLLSFLDNPVEEMITKYGDKYLQDTEHHLTLLGNAFYGTDFIANAANAYIKFNKEILREEIEFKKTGKYSATDYEEIKKSVYDNENIMSGYYLTGLYLSYFFWPHHYMIFNFFRDEFVGKLGKVEKLMEWGSGHGLLTATVLKCFPEASAKLYDISRFSVEFSKKLVRSAGFGNCTYLNEDIMVSRTERADAIICGELLEHLPEPKKLLIKIASSLQPGGAVFLTGAINSAQMDHLTLFTCPEMVYDLLKESGFNIKSSIVVAHPKRSNDERGPKVVALVATVKEHN